MKKHITLLTTLLATVFVYSQTNVSGGIYTNTTWTKANSPYIVTDTVVVFPGASLTVEPGVEVRFNDATYLEVRHALFTAIGTIGDTITFTSNSPTPLPGGWGGIGFRDSSVVNVTYCVFEYADFALRPIYIPLLPLSVTHTKFRYNNMCVGFLQPFNRLTIDSCLFELNDIGIENLRFSNISNSVFYKNEKALRAMPNCIIENCFFCDNRIGIHYADTVIDCSFTDNNIGFVNQFRYMSGCIFSGNDTALSCGISTGDSMLNNSIFDNKVGILLGYNYSDNTVINNKICSNSEYNVKYTQAPNNNLRHNCWCITDSLSIAAGIYDGYDNVNVGLVDFSQFLNCSPSSLPSAISCLGSFSPVEQITETDLVSFSVFPNPASTQLNLSISEEHTGSTFALTDLTGRVVLKSEIENHKSEISIASLPSGIYLATLTTPSGQRAVRKVVKE